MSKVSILNLTLVFCGMIRRHGFGWLTLVTTMGVIGIPLLVAPVRMGPMVAEMDRNLGLGVLLLAGTFQAVLLGAGGLAQARAGGAIQLILTRTVSRGRVWVSWIAAQLLMVLGMHLIVLAGLGLFLAWGDRDSGVLGGTWILGALLVLRAWILVVLGNVLGALELRPVSVAAGIVVILFAGHLSPLVADAGVLGVLFRLVPDLSLYVPDGLEDFDLGVVIGASAVYILGYGVLGWIGFRRMRG